MIFLFLNIIWYTSIMQCCIESKHDGEINESLHRLFSEETQLGNILKDNGKTLSALATKIENILLVYLIQPFADKVLGKN